MKVIMQFLSQEWKNLSLEDMDGKPVKVTYRDGISEVNGVINDCYVEPNGVQADLPCFRRDKDNCELCDSVENCYTLNASHVVDPDKIKLGDFVVCKSGCRYKIIGVDSDNGLIAYIHGGILIPWDIVDHVERYTQTIKRGFYIDVKTHALYGSNGTDIYRILIDDDKPVFKRCNCLALEYNRLMQCDRFMDKIAAEYGFGDGQLDE